jgi:activator of HSP90 ATPase
MNETKVSMTPGGAATRRHLIAGISIAIGSLADGSRASGQNSQSAMEEKPSAAANQTRTSIHMEIALKAGPQRIYEAILDAKQFAAFSGLPAEIDPKPGGAFAMFSGQIVGRNVELIPAQRIVQAWRPASWAAGTYSIARFELKPQGSGTTVVLDHTGFPKGLHDHLESGWHSHYWEPLKKFLA